MNSKLLDIKALGPYLVALLVIVRFVIIPLHNTLTEKRLLAAQRQELLRAKRAVMQKQMEEKAAQKPAADRNILEKHFYPKHLPDTTIQADLVKALIETAEKKKLTVMNFELPEVAREKEMSEVGALLRLRGPPVGLVELLRAIDDWPKSLKVKSLEASRSGADFTMTLTVIGYRIER